MHYPLPTISRAKRLLAKYGTSGRYYGADPAVKLAFDAWPRNEMFEEILVKVVVLNRLYSTNIYNVYGVAEHIRLGHFGVGGQAGRGKRQHGKGRNESFHVNLHFDS